VRSFTMEAIKETIGNVMQQLHDKKTGAGTSSPDDLLKKALTKKELQHIKFNNFRKGVLNLSVDSSSWLYNCSLQKEDLIIRLRRQFDALKDVRFYLGDTK